MKKKFNLHELKKCTIEPFSDNLFLVFKNVGTRNNQELKGTITKKQLQELIDLKNRLQFKNNNFNI